MKLILNLLILFAAFTLVRRMLRGLFAGNQSRPEDQAGPEVHTPPRSESGRHPAIDEDEEIEDAEFEELD